MDPLRKTLLSSPPIYKPFRYPWAYDAWYAQQKAHWLPEESPMGEDCRQWASILNDGERNLLTQIFRFFTQQDIEVNDCYAKGTEVLTARGFVDFRDLTDEDLVAQVDQSTLTTSFVEPLRRVVNDHDGHLVRLWNELGTIDVSVTPNHQVLYERVHTVDAGSRFKVTADEFKPTSCTALHTSAPLFETSVRLSPEERVLIAFQADGYKRTGAGGQRKSTYTMLFKFKKQRKIERLRQLLTEASLSWHEGSSGECTTISADWPHGQPVFDLSWINLDGKSATWCREFLREVSYWDGTSIDGGLTGQYRTVHAQCANVLSAVRALAGYRGKTTFCRGREGVRQDHWVVGWTHVYSPVRGTRINKELVPYVGKVYCVTVPHGNIVVRNGSSVLVCGNCYMTKYASVFKPIEVKMMLGAFSNMETIHIAAYSLILETLGMPETIYSAFLGYKEMKDKHDYLMAFRNDTPFEIAKTLAAFGAFAEGVQLFASFAILMNFQRFGKMRGMGQIVTWSARDETLHCVNIIRLFHAFCDENSHDIPTQLLDDAIYEMARVTVAQEDCMIDLAFELGPLQDLTADQVKLYVRFLADRRLVQLSRVPIFGVEKNPLPWMDEMLAGVEHANFFESKPTEYSKAATTGTWDEAFADE